MHIIIPVIKLLVGSLRHHVIKDLKYSHERESLILHNQELWGVSTGIDKIGGEIKKNGKNNYERWAWYNRASFCEQPVSASLLEPLQRKHLIASADCRGKMACTLASVYYQCPHQLWQEPEPVLANMRQWVEQGQAWSLCSRFWSWHHTNHILSCLPPN